MRYLWLLSLCAVLIAGGLGCSTARGGVTPREPSVTPVPANLALFGAWDVSIDPTSMSFEVAPVREAAAFGDNYWINATGYLAGVPCRDCFALRALRYDSDGHIVVTAALRHPFPPGDPAQPVSATNRLDLHVFDAQLLIAGDLDAVSATLPGGSVTVPSRLVLDADGYSDLLTNVVAPPGGTATAFPYVTIAEDPGVGNWDAAIPGGFADPQAPLGHNVFAMGAEHLVDFTLGIDADESVGFRVYFTANYGVSAASRAERLTPRYALPEYHAHAPWKLALDVPQATNNLRAGDAGSTAELAAQVWHWHAGGTVDPAMSTLDAIRAASDLASVTVAVPGIMAAPLDLGAPVSGTGPYDDPLAFAGTITNDLAAPAGEYFAVVEAQSERPVGLNSGGQTDGLSNQTGLQLDPVALTAFRTYQLAPLTVADTTRTPLSIAITPDTRQIIDQGPANALAFTATGTFAMPPFTEDITATVTWESSAIDVGVFDGDNTLEGVGLGMTEVTATQASVTSPETTVLVKPLLFESTGIPGQPKAVDANQSTGDVFVSNGAALNHYTDQAVFLNSIPVPFDPLALAVDEPTGEFWVARDGVPPVINTARLSPTGMVLTSFSVDNVIGPRAMTFTETGELWMPEWVGTHNDVQRFDTATGAQIDGFDCPQAAVLFGISELGQYFAIANPGHRNVNAVIVVDWQAKTQVAAGGIVPSNYGQNSFLAFDRDGFIHMDHQGDNGANLPGVIRVFEFDPVAGSVTELYTYTTGTGYSACFGLAISRPNNVVAQIYIPGTPGTWQVKWLD